MILFYIKILNKYNKLIKMNNMNMNPMTFNAMLNMMNQLYPNMGYNMNNFNMYNNQFLYCLMMNWMMMNPSLIQTYNNLNQNNQFNMNQINQFNNNNPNRKGMSVISVSQEDLNQAKVTGGGVISNNFQNMNCDFSSPDDLTPKYNIYFKTQKDQQMNIFCPCNLKIKDLLIKYINRLGLGPGVMGSSIFFLFNSAKLDLNENRTVGEMGMTSGSTVVVLDIRGVIGS